MAAILCIGCGAVGDSDGAALYCNSCYEELQERTKELEMSGRALAKKINEVITNGEYMDVWLVAQLHRGPYAGPSFEKELLEFLNVLYSDAVEQGHEADADLAPIWKPIDPEI